MSPRSSLAHYAQKDAAPSIPGSVAGDRHLRWGGLLCGFGTALRSQNHNFNLNLNLAVYGLTCYNLYTLITDNRA